MKTNILNLRGLNGRILQIATICLIAGALTLYSTGCSTTKDASGNTTTTVTQSGDAAIAAAIQIATVAANAAIQTYLTTTATTKPQLRRSARQPAIVAAEAATEAEIHNALPSLPAEKIHNIVKHAFAERLNTTP